MTAKRKQLHSKKTSTVSYYNRKRIISDRESRSEIIVGRPIIVSPNENYIIRRFNTNKIQILHRFRIKKFVPNQPLDDSFREVRLQPEEEIIIPQDDLYIISWETNFAEQLVTRGNEPISTSLPKGERPVTSNADLNYADENEVDYIVATDNNPNDVNDPAQQRNERMNDDVSKRNEKK